MANENDAVSPPENLSVTITSLDSAQREGDSGGSRYSCTMTIAGDLSVPRTLYWRAVGSGDHPADDADFGGGALGGVIFNPGETTKTFTFWVYGDYSIEPDETFIVTPYDPPSRSDYGTAAQFTILNDDARIAITALTPSLREDSGGGPEFLFEVRRWGDLSQTHILPWSVQNNGVTTQNDFVGGAFPQSVVTFAPGETHKTIAIQVAPDTDVESAESFTVELPNIWGVIDGPNWASSAILNDDATVDVKRLEMEMAEGDAGATLAAFEVLLAGDTSVARTLSWKVTPMGLWIPPGFGHSADAADFVGGVLPSGTVTFEVGETRKTFTVAIAGDTLSETDEGYQVILSDLPTGLTTGYWPSSAASIGNDDPLPAKAHDDAYVTTQGHWVTGQWPLQAPGVLANDIGDETASLVGTGPSHGTIEFQANGLFTYKPNAGFAGIDSFTYHAVGPDGADDGRVTIHVAPVVEGQKTTLNLLALTPEEQVAAAYVAFAGRAADAGGFEFWVNEFHAGLPTQGAKALIANIASSFAVSDEARGLYAFLTNPGGASDNAIGTFLNGVYNNLFNRPTDDGGLVYWTGQIRQKMAAGEFVGSVLVDIMSGAQTGWGSLFGHDDLSTLMGKVAVSLAFVHAQQEHGMAWNGAADTAAATDLLKDVYSAASSILIGVRDGEDYVAAHD